MHVRLSNGHVHGVDFVVSATGVTPSTQWLPADVQRDPRCVRCAATCRSVQPWDQWLCTLAWLCTMLRALLFHFDFLLTMQAGPWCQSVVHGVHV